MWCKAKWEYTALQHRCPFDSGVSGATIAAQLTSHSRGVRCEEWLSHCWGRRPVWGSWIGSHEEFFPQKAAFMKLKAINMPPSIISSVLWHFPINSRCSFGPGRPTLAEQQFPTLPLQLQHCYCFGHNAAAVFFCRMAFSEFPSDSCAWIHFLSACNRPRVESNYSEWYALYVRFEVLEPLANKLIRNKAGDLFVHQINSIQMTLFKRDSATHEEFPLCVCHVHTASLPCFYIWLKRALC